MVNCYDWMDFGYEMVLIGSKWIMKMDMDFGYSLKKMDLKIELGYWIFDYKNGCGFLGIIQY